MVETSEPQASTSPSYPQLFTDEWVEWLGETLADNHVDENLEITIEHCVKLQNNDDFWWHTRVANGQIKVQNGRAHSSQANVDDPNLLTFKSNYDTACAVALGKKPVQTAFLEGKIRMKGNINKLIEASSVLNSLKIADTYKDSCTND